MIEYKTYPNTPAFNETPDGIITTFTVDDAFIVNTLVVVHGGMIWKGITTPDTTTIEFDVAPPAGESVYISSGFFGTGNTSATYHGYLALLSTLLQDNIAVLSEGEQITFLQAAIQAYTKFRPFPYVTDSVGNDTYTLALPNNWDAEYSVLNAIEYFLTTVPETLLVLPPDEYEKYTSPTDTVIRGVVAKFASNYTYRIRYAIQHTFTPETCTIPQKDQEAIYFLAASKACLALAANVIPVIDQEFGNTIIENQRGRKSQAEEYQTLAREYEKKWRIAMDLPIGIDQQPPIAAMATMEWQGSGKGKLLHSF